MNVMDGKEQQQRYYPYEKSESQQLSLERTQSPDFMKWLLDSGEEIELWRMTMKGFEKDESGQKWVKKYDALLNDKGIERIILQLRLYLQKTTVLSNMSDEQILVKAEYFATGMVLYVYAHNDEFGIGHDYTQRSMMLDTVSNLFHMTLLRARNALQLKSITENIQRSETFQIRPQEKKPWWKMWG